MVSVVLSWCGINVEVVAVVVGVAVVDVFNGC